MDAPRYPWVHNQHGTTLLEAVMALAIFSFITISLTTLITMGIHIVRDDQSRLDAIAIAQSEMEAFKNVPYDSIGTINGLPSGPFAQEEVVLRNDRQFTILRDVRYVDDPYDGVSPIDTVNTDYKQVRIEVKWEGQYVQEPVLLLTTISPNGIETNSGGGTLWVEVYNANAEPVVNASVHITNSATNPTINITSLTDSNGRVILPGAPASAQSYHVEVTKANYSSSQTYMIDPITNPNPDPTDVTVIEGEVATTTFFIDLRSSLNFLFTDYQTTLPISGFPFDLSGNKRIGTDLDGASIPKYASSFTTNELGVVDVTQLEYDTYALEFDDAATGYDYAGGTPSFPLVVAPNTTTPVILSLAPNADFTALLTVTDNAGVPQVGASIHLFNTLLGIDQTVVTNLYGQAFFTPLALGQMTIEVTQIGYDLYTSTIDITGDEQQTILLTTTLP